MSNYSDSAFREDNQNNSWYKILRLIPQKAKVLDVGCSSGNFGAELIERKDCIVDGLDIDEKDVTEAAKKLRNVRLLDIERDSVDDITERYDVIYFGDVIEHLVNPSKSLQKIKQLLKPDGRVVFSIPNMAHVTVRLQLLKGEFEHTETGLIDKTHLHFYNLTEVQNVFKEAGFAIRKIDFVEKDYPDELIEAYLEKLGLKANKDFYDMMRQVDAAAFQFVGEAVVAKPGMQSVKRRQFGPIDFFESFYHNNIDALRERIVELEKERDNLVAQKIRLESRLEYQDNHPLRSAAGAVKRKLKNRDT